MCDLNLSGRLRQIVFYSWYTFIYFFIFVICVAICVECARLPVSFACSCFYMYMYNTFSCKLVFAII